MCHELRGFAGVSDFAARRHRAGGLRLKDYEPGRRNTLLAGLLGLLCKEEQHPDRQGQLHRNPRRTKPARRSVSIHLKEKTEPKQ